jgi:hypothetical protein
VNLKNIIETLQIVDRLMPDSSRSWLQAEHDVIYLPMGNETAISAEDEKRLIDLGAFKSSQSDTWAVLT